MRYFLARFEWLEQFRFIRLHRDSGLQSRHSGEGRNPVVLPSMALDPGQSMAGMTAPICFEPVHSALHPLSHKPKML
jgi:hypothetical protein